MKRKLTWLIALAVVVSIPSGIWGGTKTKKSETPQVASSTYPLGTILAFSLKVLQQRLQEAPQKTLAQQDIRHLAGITRIDGYVVDEANHDLILYGRVDPAAPPLFLDDFVVALRNVWLKYAELKGNTYYYSDPGCSIDPKPKVIQALDEVSRSLQGKSTLPEKQQEIKNWGRVCSSPQQVRVLGIPFDTRFASVMVKADYDMKNLVSGADALNIPGFISLSDMHLETAKSNVMAGKPLALASMNRFWFHPGKNLYKEDQGVVNITKCPVILLTEEEHLHQKQMVGKGHADPSAQKFAESFSAHYSEVAQCRPIYQELEGLFRLVALAKIMKFKGADKEAGLNLACLLEQYPVSKVAVSRQLPGRSHVKNFEYKRELKGSYSVAHVWLPSCGGVGISLKIDPTVLVLDTSGKIIDVKTKALNRRPAPEALYWPFITTDEVKLDGRYHPVVCRRSEDQGHTHL